MDRRRPPPIARPVRLFAEGRARSRGGRTWRWRSNVEVETERSRGGEELGRGGRGRRVHL
uniref:Uncharacterized protein n=1 Tax=Arundo donax TaxID=35708 RepID=A0A0A9AEL5_ARUDO